jgi:hypothetical protein
MRDISWMTYLMVILASYRFTHLIVFDKITEFIRKPFMKEQQVMDKEGHAHTKQVPKSKFGYLLNCYWCAGVWSAILFGCSYLFLTKIAWPIIFIFSIAGASAIIETMVGVGSRWIAYLSKELHDE